MKNLENNDRTKKYLVKKLKIINHDFGKYH